MMCENTCTGNPQYASNGYCQDGGSGAIGNTFSQHYLFPDMPVQGQYFNLGLWFIGSALSMKAMTGALPFMKK